ncbi:Rhodanese-like domain-containing protein [Ilyonectria robusta]|uniref:Rhodanese-like domain-containing protein n=1 Tax=Ilyonectria robusta TaxID=1079257 RepID=UPI001E8E9093|nr:Rhodanese-like domain-containing protein [Ilyonectria robusta]KAH8687008.1 Rhodanese-like domain-containing protein [Ilyonectria robusta]
MQLFSRFRKSALNSVRTMTTIADIRRVSAKSLSEKILDEREAKETTFAIVDVRDDDYLGGHIKGCTNVPAHTLDAMMATLVRNLKDKKTVVFHCALSQIRGPSAALKYLRERDGLLRAMGETPKGAEGQEVLVLDGGFQGWQEVYGTDERLTEGYRKELWENY